MPKNQFQRPVPITHTHQVPRHNGSPRPKVKAPPVSGKSPQSGGTPLPTLAEMLMRQSRTR